MNNFSQHNSNFPLFIVETFRLAIVKFFSGLWWGLTYLWKPACDTCTEREPECITRNEPCIYQRNQKQSRLMLLLGLPIVILIVMILYNADHKYQKVKEQAATTQIK